MAPAAAPVPPTPAPRASGRGGLVVAGVVVLALIVAGAAWQFGAFNRPVQAAAAQPVPTAQVAPLPATPVVTAPDVGPSISNVASVPQWGNAAPAPKSGR